MPWTIPSLHLGPLPYGFSVSITSLDSPRAKENTGPEALTPPVVFPGAEEDGEIHWVVGSEEGGSLGLCLGHYGYCSSGLRGPACGEESWKPVGPSWSGKRLALGHQVWSSGRGVSSFCYFSFG